MKKLNKNVETPSRIRDLRSTPPLSHQFFLEGGGGRGVIQNNPFIVGLSSTADVSLKKVLLSFNERVIKKTMYVFHKNKIKM
jgi:hypothetical protein